MKTLIAGIVVVIIIVGGYVAFHKSPSSKSNSSSSTTSSSTTAPNTISFDGNKFSPAVLTVKSGTMVTVKNASSQDLQMDSNPHPVHTDDTDLNVGLVSAGQSQTFTASKTGSFGYHDHLDPSIQGKITIN